MSGSVRPVPRQAASLLAALLCLAGGVVQFPSAWAATPAAAAAPATSPLGATPPRDAMPGMEFVFEARVTLSPAVPMGDTDLGGRQFIPITGGKVAGPKFKGEVMPGGWDYQLRLAGGCQSLSADYFLRADDGAIIHVLNQAFMCGSAAPGERTLTRPTFEAPKGSAHEWLTRGAFVGVLELDPPPAAGKPLQGIRIRFYQVK
jgi:hypothetical protein